MMKQDSGLPASFWHRQFLRQASWTRALRLHLYRQAGLGRRTRILELGCGTGVIAAEVAARTQTEVWAVDSDPGLIDFAKAEHRGLSINWVVSRADDFVCDCGQFDLVITHFFWLWAVNTTPIFLHVNNLLSKRGLLMALAEPDYSARIDRPEPLSNINQFIIEDLKAKGADPFIGAKLKSMFLKAGLATEAGSITTEWNWERHQQEFDAEWDFLESAMSPSTRLAELKDEERNTIRAHERSSVMPVHWAIGSKG